MLSGLAFPDSASSGWASLNAVDDNEAIKGFLETGDGDLFRTLVKRYQRWQQEVSGSPWSSA
jgi:hypothetical protein